MHKENVRTQLKNNPALAQQELDSKYGGKAVTTGWCRLVNLAPTKHKGYVQVSLANVNKIGTLGEIVLWASGRVVQEGQQASHRCNQPRCMVSSHIVVESVQANNARKNCLVSFPCQCCGKHYVLCKHEPRCINFIEGFSSMEEFLDSPEIHDVTE